MIDCFLKIADVSYKLTSNNNPSSYSTLANRDFDVYIFVVTDIQEECEM